jgi:hypothetical protein
VDLAAGQVAEAVEGGVGIRGIERFVVVFAAAGREGRGEGRHGEDEEMRRRAHGRQAYDVA